MLKHKLVGFGIASAFLLGSVSCSNDDSATLIMEDGIVDPTDTITDPVVDGPMTIDGELGKVQIFNADLLSNDLILVNDARNNQVYVMDRLASLLHQWELSNNIGNDVFLQSDGRLLACLESDSPQIPFGGQGGQIQFVDKDGNTDWDFVYSTPQAETHHDIESMRRRSQLLV